MPLPALPDVTGLLNHSTAVQCSELLACAICGNTKQVKGYGKWLLGQDLALCFDCFCVWYDGETDPEKIKAKSMTAQANAKLTDPLKGNNERT